MAQNHKLRLVEIGDAAGDDQADSGSKTAERDAAPSLLRTLLDRRAQAEHALQRLDEGTYGYCEGCAQPDPGGAAGGLPVRHHVRAPASQTASAARADLDRRRTGPRRPSVRRTGRIRAGVSGTVHG